MRLPTIDPNRRQEFFVEQDHDDIDASFPMLDYMVPILYFIPFLYLILLFIILMICERFDDPDIDDDDDEGDYRGPDPYDRTVVLRRHYKTHIV